MKLARFLMDGAPRLGVVDDVAQVVRLVPANLTNLQQVMAAPSFTPGDAVALAGLTLLAPILPQRNIFCVGKNYRDHAREFAQSGFEAGASRDKPVDDYPAILPSPPVRSSATRRWCTCTPPSPPRSITRRNWRSSSASRARTSRNRMPGAMSGAIPSSTT